ncbi:MAG: M23 family metallopeptidase [Treponema sp.]|jgi:murein DD-endopeptidase MepM/ murein hydrolase activator NlpD|nr:M23 family metallopeptidase [Treponema sp.]
MNSLLSADTKYTVKKGDTLYSIGRKYQLTVQELRTANNMDESDMLKAGSVIIVPGADIGNAAALTAAPSETAQTSGGRQEYLVRKGDTFYGISRKYHITLSELFAMNGLGSGAVLKAGQKLFVPAATAEKKTDGRTVPVEQDRKQQPIPDLPSADPREYSAAKSGDSQLEWPVRNPSVTYVKGKVSGVQLSAKKNEPVTAIRAGTIMYCGLYRGFGNVVFIQSKTGLIYAYSGLGTVSVKKGEYLVFGDRLGTAGVDTITSRPQLTLMVFQNGTPIDPAKAPRG